MSQKKKTTSPRQELLKIEKKIFKQNQSMIDDSVNVADKNFKRYQKNYLRAVRKYKSAENAKGVEDKILSSRLVLVGDFHTLDQSQRSFIRVLRGFIRHHHKKIVVALETVQAKHQRHLDGFMSGKILASSFIKKIGFKEHWFFDLWENYTVIFDFLKYHQIPTIAIDADAKDKFSLLERDAFMAERLIQIAKEHPESIIFVLVGDLHLAPEHLPNKIQKQATQNKIKLPLMSLFQNSPEIYWQLSEKELVDHTLIVKLRDGAYCRMHTPPIIAQQSYINWLYHEEGVFDWIDAQRSFLGLVKQMAQILEFKLPDDYENVEVYTCGDLSFLKLLQTKKILSKKEIQFTRTQVLNSESYFLSKARIVYIANVSIHHAAEEGSHYLKFLFSGPEQPRDQKDAFYANVLHEALGFFGSKLINNKRKCARLKDFISEKKYLENMGLHLKNPVAYETTVLFIKHHRSLNKQQLIHTNKVMTLSQDLFLSLTHAIGYDLGDHLYYGFMSGEINKAILQDLYTNRFDLEGETGRVYLKLVKILKAVKRPQRI